MSSGLVANTSAPEPVSSVTAAARLAELGVPRNVATLVPRAVSPVPPRDAGSACAVVAEVLARLRPDAFVRTTADGVPRLGVVSAGEVLSTTEPVPVEVVTPVPPEATGRADPSVSDVRWVATSSTLVPSL